MLDLASNLAKVGGEGGSKPPRQTASKFLTKPYAGCGPKIAKALTMSISKVRSTVCRFPVPKADILLGFFACLQDFRPFPFSSIGDGAEGRLLYGDSPSGAYTLAGAGGAVENTSAGYNR